MFYIQGESTISFQGKKYHMQPEQLLYLPKGQDNNDYSISIGKEVLLYNIYFDTDIPLPDHPIQFTAKTDELRLLYERLYRTWAAKSESFYYRAVRYTYRIIEILRWQQLAYFQSKEASQLSLCDAYLSTHYMDKKFDYGELTQLSGLSYSYFKKLFIRKYGVPPVRQVNRMKIAHACELLETGQFTVGQVADMCGFENTYYFSTVFKNHIGVSPKNYTTAHTTLHRKTFP
jgi:AraC-like DNA-binding protein